MTSAVEEQPRTALPRVGEAPASLALGVLHGVDESASCAQCPLRMGERRCPCRAARVAYAGLGVGCVGLGALGAVLPGLPTTVFLIAAAWLFTRSSPALERALLRNRLFAPYLRYLNPSSVMPMKARIVALGMMWAASLTSAALLAVRGQVGVMIAGVIVACAAIGTRCIWRYRRGPQPASP